MKVFLSGFLLLSISYIENNFIHQFSYIRLFAIVIILNGRVSFIKIYAFDFLPLFIFYIEESFFYQDLSILVLVSKLYILGFHLSRFTYLIIYFYQYFI